MQKSDQINELATALAKAQAELTSAKKDSKGHGYNYSDLATVIEEAKKVLPKHGLSFTQLVGKTSSTIDYESNGTMNVLETIGVTTILLHSSGQFISSEGSIRIPEMRGVNDTQKAGAALSYLRRYSLQAILGMASEDNDASSATGDDKKSFADKKAASTTVSEAVTTKDVVVATDKPTKTTSSFKRNVSNGGI
jgi:hypothetical protein